MFASFNVVRAIGAVRGRIIGVWITIASVLALAVLFISATPSLSLACACGCGIFEVGTASLFPQGSGGQVWMQYEYMDQYIDWHATTPASAVQNNDKYIRTQFMEVGGQYMFDRDWGVMLEVPYWVRTYKGAYQGNNEDLSWHEDNSIGDIRIQGMYTGLSEDMSTGLLLGVKVPSGYYHYPWYDRDTQIGTGSTDLLFGGYHLGTLPFKFRDRSFNWFAQASYDLPLFTQDHYKPGRELDGAVGSYYNFGQVGFLKELAPMFTILYSDRVRDSQSQANPQNSGYTRFVVAPGAEITTGVIRTYADIEIPVFQNMNGFQLTAPFATKLVVSYSF